VSEGWSAFAADAQMPNKRRTQSLATISMLGSEAW
jgi:hypothetical protein